MSILIKSRSTVLCVLAVNLLLLAQGVAGNLLTDEHVDFAVDYDPVSGELALSLRDDDDLETYHPHYVLIHASPNAYVTVPAGLPDYYGPAGSNIWLLQSLQQAGVVWLGASTEIAGATAKGIGYEARFLGKGIPAGVFVDNRVNVRLIDFRGPGEFFLNTSSGGFELEMYTGDGLDADDSLNLGINAHRHYNWGLRGEGLFFLTFQAEGDLVAGGTAVSEPVTLKFYTDSAPEDTLPDDLDYAWFARVFENLHGLTPGALADPGADFDGDDVPNLGEFGLFWHGLDPCVPDAHKIRYPLLLNTAMPGATLTAQWTDDLTTWLPPGDAQLPPGLDFALEDLTPYSGTATPADSDLKLLQPTWVPSAAEQGWSRVKFHLNP